MTVDSSVLAPSAHTHGMKRSLRSLAPRSTRLTNPEAWDTKRLM